MCSVATASTSTVELVQSEQDASFHRPSDRKNAVPPSDSDCNLTLGSIFWHANLTCHTYVHGDPKVSFDDLWPSSAQLSELLACLCEVERQHVTLACCKLALRCGPVRMLQALLHNRLIDLNHTSDDGMSLLHIACLAANKKAVAFLLSQGASLKITDKKGRTADQLCFSSRARKELPARYQTSPKVYKKQQSSFEDKRTIFKLVMDLESFEDLQVMLHTLDFDVNRDKDSLGDLLIHRAVRQGMPHLALIMNLVLVHQADVEATDHKGMTPLCIVAHLGYGIIAEVLMCILGADPNATSLNCWTPLHFAAKKNKVSVIECLARREADLNAEDKFGFRADDIAKKVGNQECQDIIENLRLQRCQRLSFLAKKGNLTPHIICPSDLYTVDSAGSTLVMVTAQANRCDNLMVLLHKEKCPIDAQETKFGRTALSLAAMLGKVDAVQTLLRYGAHPGIADMKGMFPLHHACLNEHVLCVQTIVNTQSGLTGLSKATKCTENAEICNIIQEAISRRQTNIVNPTLFECAMNGDADRLYCTLEEGDDVNPLTGTGDWPMYMAVGNRYLKVMQLLLENGGNIWSPHETTGSTVLHIACSRGLHGIVSYLLKVLKTNRGCSSPSQIEDGESGVNEELNINAINYQGHTALQVAAVKGYSHIVKLLLSHGASAALVDSKGQLYKCSEYEGVQVLIEHHQRSRTGLIMSYIKSSNKAHKLIKVWQAKFDHNLRNHNGDTPLLVACLYGNVQAVKFLLRSAVQCMERNGQDLEMSQQKGKSDCLVDSGAFDESHPGCHNAKNISLQTIEDGTELDTSVTDFSDQEIGTDGAVWKQSIAHSSKRKGFSSSVNLQSRHSVRRDSSMYHSYDSESLDDSVDDSDSSKRYTGNQILVNSMSAVSTDDLKGWYSVGDVSDRDHGTCTSSRGLPQARISRIVQGNYVNHLCAVNKRDGCSAMHRAVECIHEKRGLENLHLLVEKDSSVVNLQNFQGLTALHLAAKLERKKIVKSLTSLQCVNLNLRTPSGKLAEDMTQSKRISRLIQDARQKGTRLPSSVDGLPSSVDGLPVPPPSSVGGTSVDFDKLVERFEQLRHSNKSDR